MKFWNKYKYQLLVVLAHINLILLGFYLGGWEIFLAIISGWVISNLYHYLYIHRIYTHGHFVVSNFQHFIGQFIFCMLNLGSPPIYAAVHMKHHNNSGKDNDPHNPYVIGFWRALFSAWGESFVPDRKFLKRYMEMPYSKWFHKHHLKIAIASVIFTPYVVVVAFWMSKIVVLVVHVKSFGYQSKIGAASPNPDTSRNVWWLKPLTWGEEMHNNHHYYASRPNHNVEGSLREFDPLYYVGKFIGRNRDG